MTCPPLHGAVPLDREPAARRSLGLRLAARRRASRNFRIGSSYSAADRRLPPPPPFAALGARTRVPVRSAALRPRDHQSLLAFLPADTCARSHHTGLGARDNRADVSPRRAAFIPHTVYRRIFPPRCAATRRRHARPDPTPGQRSVSHRRHVTSPMG